MAEPAEALIALAIAAAPSLVSFWYVATIVPFHFKASIQP